MACFLKRAVGILALSLVAASNARAEDYFLTVAGGYSPTGNQVSLERNVEFFRRVLAQMRPDRPTHDVYFADGSDPHRDLQFRDEAFDCPPARRIVLELFGKVDHVDIAYRNHHLDDVRGATSPDAVEKWLDELAGRVQPGDRVFVYATAHGGASDDQKRPYNTKLYTWQRRTFTSEQFSNWLDKFPEDVPVVLVMVQCYAGGFSHTIFNEGNSEKGLAPHLRCGFFSQVHDRVAAGCTPDVNEADYQEYSSFFWAALTGQTRLGQPIRLVDFDGDGLTSFAEAHAYAVIESHTVDIPLRTSDALLQQYSRLASGEGENSVPAEGEPRRLPAVDLIDVSGPLSALLIHADPIDRQIAQHLAAKLNIDLAGDASQLEGALQRARRDLQDAERTRSRIARNHRRAQQRVVAQVKREWPELESDHSPKLAALMSEEAEEFVAKVTAMSSYKTMKERAEELGAASSKMFECQKHDALVRRIQQIFRRIALAQNLPKTASPDLVLRYQELLELESSTLQPPGPGLPPRITPVGESIESPSPAALQ